VFLWFVGGALVCVWAVLQDPAVDYRMVMVGALLPDMVDAPFGAIGIGHTLAASVGLLFTVMVLTVGRRRLRRRLLAVPIGSFVHLLLDGMWTDARVFWWPFRGLSLAHVGALPSFAHPVGLTVAEEVAGALAVVWWWRRFRLSEPDHRSRFLRSGRLGSDLGPRGGTAGLPGPRRQPRP